MAIVLLAAFIAVPVIEIAAFIQIGGWIGLWPTIAVVVLTAFAGTTLLRLQGLAVLQRAQEAAARNELPVTEVFDGLCLLVAGVLLLTPGFFTDALGFLLFVPPLRHLVALGLWNWLVRSGRVSFSAGGFYSGPPPGGGRSGGPRGGNPPGRGPVIDGEYEDMDTSSGRNGSGAGRIGPGDRNG